MAKYAFIQDNRVVEIQTIDNEELVSSLSRRFQNTLDITNHVPQPQVGWVFSGNRLVVPAEINTPEYVQANILEPAASFGLNLSKRFASENILQGITQAGKTMLVGDALRDVAYYMERGSLFAAEAKIIQLSQNLDPALSPFVTTERLLRYRNLIRQYLGLPAV